MATGLMEQFNILHFITGPFLFATFILLIYWLLCESKVGEGVQVLWDKQDKSRLQKCRPVFKKPQSQQPAAHLEMRLRMSRTKR